MPVLLTSDEQAEAWLAIEPLSAKYVGFIMLWGLYSWVLVYLVLVYVGAWIYFTPCLLVSQCTCNMEAVSFTIKNAPAWLHSPALQHVQDNRKKYGFRAPLLP